MCVVSSPIVSKGLDAADYVRFSRRIGSLAVRHEIVNAQLREFPFGGGRVHIERISAGTHHAAGSIERDPEYRLGVVSVPLRMVIQQIGIGPYHIAEVGEVKR